MFIAQCLHGSNGFKYQQNLAMISIWLNTITGTPRKDGNTPEADGDGQLYKGRGLIQITGRYNYQQCGHLLQLTLLKNTTLSFLEIHRHAVASACWFWADKNLIVLLVTIK